MVLVVSISGDWERAELVCTCGFQQTLVSDEWWAGKKKKKGLVPSNPFRNCLFCHGDKHLSSALLLLPCLICHHSLVSAPVALPLQTSERRYTFHAWTNCACWSAPPMAYHTNAFSISGTTRGKTPPIPLLFSGSPRLLLLWLRSVELIWMISQGSDGQRCQSGPLLFPPISVSHTATAILAGPTESVGGWLPCLRASWQWEGNISQPTLSFPQNTPSSVHLQPLS